MLDPLAPPTAAAGGRGDLYAAFETMPQAVMVFDRNARCCYANSAATRILGMRLAELDGSSPIPLDLIDISGRPIPKQEQLLARVLATGVPVQDFVVGLVAQDGARQWLNVNVGPLMEAGAIAGAIAAFTDVTAMRRITTALRSSETIHRQLMESLADGIFVAQDFQLVFANPALAELLGRPHESVPGLSFRKLIPPEIYAFWTERYVKRIGLGPEPPRRYETRLLHADGTTRIDVEIVATRTRYGERAAVLGVVRDIRERIRLADELAQYRSGLEALVGARTAESTAALAALRQSEQSVRLSNVALADAEKFTRDITDNLPVRIAYWDRELRCRFVNRAYCQWFGASPDSIIGHSFGEIFADAGTGDRAARIRAALEGNSAEFQDDRLGEDGKFTQAHVHLIPDRKDGAVRGVLVLAIDVTTQRRAQIALELVNEQLVSARDRAESAGRAKSAFLANMSHEIRTPMNAIIGLTHLLKKDVTDLAQGERLGRIEGAAQHLLHIVNDVLDLSKIEAGKAVVETAPFDVAQMLQAAVTMVEEKGRSKRLALHVDGAALPRHAVGDPMRISQALVNLLDNAIKFTERGAVSVHGSVLEAGGGTMLLRFEVQDSGIGIAADQLGRLFSAFEQAETSTTRRFGGTGLGLALTRHLARLMGGDAGASSVPGQGSSFWFTVRVAAAPGPSATVAVADAAAFLRTHHAGAQVLVAEDNAINQEVASSLLTSVGLVVDLADDGQAAIEHAARKEYAIILMDLQMPVVDGLEASRAIRRLPRGASVPIVAVTANAFAEDRARALDAGMNDHLGKPVDPATLYATVARWLGAAPAESPEARLQRIATIEGLDLDRGMAFFAGRSTPYLKALDTFVRLYAPGWAGVGADDATARRELHTVGSVCASIGAAELAAFAHELLGQGRAGEPKDARPPVPAESLARFGARLAALTGQLAERLAR